MPQHKRILLADADTAFSALLAGALEATNRFFVTCETDGADALSRILSAPPDILISEAALPGLDGLGLLYALQARRIFIPRILIISSFVSQSAAAEAAALGAIAFLPKPFAPETLAERLVYLCESDEMHAAFPLGTIVAATLHSLGVPAHLKGYRFLREALILSLRDESLLQGMTKVLYPLIAKQCGGTASQVERDIRRAIETSWANCDPAAADRYFGPVCSSGRPSNGLYIATLTSRLAAQLPARIFRP